MTISDEKWRIILQNSNTMTYGFILNQDDHKLMTILPNIKGHSTNYEVNEAVVRLAEQVILLPKMVGLLQSLVMFLLHESLVPPSLPLIQSAQQMLKEVDK